MSGHETPNEGATNVWLTPQHIIDALGPFNLDPCAATEHPFRCGVSAYTAADDGLSLPWFGLVFCNPPYGPHVGAWLRRCEQHGNAIALVMARTETKAINPILHRVPVVVFLEGRLKFLRPDLTTRGNAGAPSMILGWGEQAITRINAAWSRGQINGAYFRR